MIFKFKPGSASVMRPRVTPDPSHAAELERRINSLAYHPENAFHRDRLQDRMECRRLRRAGAM